MSVTGRADDEAGCRAGSKVEGGVADILYRASCQHFFICALPKRGTRSWVGGSLSTWPVTGCAGGLPWPNQSLNYLTTGSAAAHAVMLTQGLSCLISGLPHGPIGDFILHRWNDAQFRKFCDV